MVLENVVLSPSNSVTYMPTEMKQLAEVSIENNEATPIVFKWKSTRPGMYKMRPVYGLVRPNEKKTIRLIFKGLGDKKCPTKDHYTCVLVATTSSNVRPEFVWKQHRCRAQMAESSIVKRTLKILFAGVNDGPNETGRGNFNRDGDEDGKSIAVAVAGPVAKDAPTAAPTIGKIGESHANQGNVNMQLLVGEGNQKQGMCVRVCDCVAGSKVRLPPRGASWMSSNG
ncbi:hypothetical protein WR25_23114 [Diploscapter pachys]|uniref:Major sperm protein n=1 Tax=Diploscapter pachys TaxID=2018661 RepID=A0A2A2LQG1_9BILA|nr:hypothetical protein WR25_23114 [Diploscapter pachys]